MKLSEIKVGDLVYVIRNQYDWDLASPVTVVEVGVTQDVWNGWQYVSSSRKTGVKVRRTDYQGKVIDEVFDCRQIKSEADVLAKREVSKAEKARTASVRDQAQADVDVIKEYLVAAGSKSPYVYLAGNYDEPYIHLGRFEAARLAKMLKELAPA